MEPVTFAVFALIFAAAVGAGIWAKRNPRIPDSLADAEIEDEWSKAVR